jgi:hypothetical protein
VKQGNAIWINLADKSTRKVRLAGIESHLQSTT